MALLEEAMSLARSKDRRELLYPTVQPHSSEQDKDKVFLITTFHPVDHTLKNIVFKNWDLLGKSPTTCALHERKLMLGYRRPKNLKDILVKANVPYKAGDEDNRPLDFPPLNREVKVEPTTPTLTTTVPKVGDLTKLVQRSMKDFFPTLREKVIPTIADQQKVGASGGLPLKTKGGTPHSRRGFNFCNFPGNCRYCPRLNKDGFIKCSVTGKDYRCMSNVSCRSSNLIYCVTCKRCNIQYVGQTSLRLKDRFVHHFYSIEKKDQLKPVGKHFSQISHEGLDDVEIHILEFIKKPPTSEVAKSIRNKVEKRWIHLFKTPAPLGLNLDD